MHKEKCEMLSTHNANLNSQAVTTHSSILEFTSSKHSFFST